MSNNFARYSGNEVFVAGVVCIFEYHPYHERGDNVFSLRTEHSYVWFTYDYVHKTRSISGCPPWGTSYTYAKDVIDSFMNLMSTRLHYEMIQEMEPDHSGDFAEE